MKRWQISDKWRGGKGPMGSKELPALVVFTAKEDGNAGHNECFIWIHQHTSYSFHWATTHAGYEVKEVE